MTYFHEISNIQQAPLINFIDFVKECIINLPNKNQCVFEEKNGDVFYLTNVPFPNMNGIVIFEKNTQRVIEKINVMLKRFENSSMPMTLIWPHQCTVPEDFASKLAQNNFHALGEYLSISGNIDDCFKKQFEILPYQQITQVESEQDFDDFIFITGKSFNVPEDALIPLKKIYNGFSNSKKLKFYLFKENNKAISALIAFKAGDTLGVYNGATLPGYQKKGVMTAFCQSVIKEHNDCKSVVAQLMLQQNALSIAEQLGIKKVASFYPFCKGFDVSEMVA